MKSLGFDKPLYILPFDHRGSFQKKMFGWDGTLTPQQTEEIAAAKRVIYDAFKLAVESGVPKDKAGILVDEQFGAAILRDAHRDGYSTSCSAEKSGQDEFDFEYGEDFAAHIEAFEPTFCKVLVRYNPEGDRGLNRRQKLETWQRKGNCLGRCRFFGQAGFRTGTFARVSIHYLRHACYAWNTGWVRRFRPTEPNGSAAIPHRLGLLVSQILVRIERASKQTPEELPPTVAGRRK